MNPGSSEITDRSPRNLICMDMDGLHFSTLCLEGIYKAYVITVIGEAKNRHIVSPGFQYHIDSWDLLEVALLGHLMPDTWSKDISHISRCNSCLVEDQEHTSAYLVTPGALIHPPRDFFQPGFH